jgi:hypothetical protein
VGHPGAGTVELAIPKLRSGSYYPHWLLERRHRAEQALISVVATAYLLGVSTRRVEKLAESLGVTQLSKSQVSAMAKHLDEQVAAFRNRPLDQGPYAFVWVDALTQKVREGGRIINVHALIAVGVNADGHREILGIDVASSEDGAGWLAFLRSLVARGLSGVQLVVSDAQMGLVNAIGATLSVRGQPVMGPVSSGPGRSGDRRSQRRLALPGRRARRQCLAGHHRQRADETGRTGELHRRSNWRKNSRDEVLCRIRSLSTRPICH